MLTNANNFHWCEPYIGKSQNIKRSEYLHSRIKAIANWAVNRAANFTIDTDIEAEENSES